MKNLRLKIIVVLLATFVLLAVIYVLDFKRIDTMEKIERKGSHTAEDYMLSSLNVTALSQDLQQRIWIGTSAGLNVYDGNGYTQFFHDPNDTAALPDDYINVVHRDRAGNMWVGTQNGLARYEGGYRFRRFPVPDADRNITVIRDAEGTTDHTAVVVGNGRNWYRVNSTGILGKAARQPQIKPMKDYAAIGDSTVLLKPRELVSALFEDAGGNLWVGFHNAGYRVISDNVVAYTKANANSLARATKGMDITSLERVGSHILAGTTLRLYAYDTQTDRYGQRFYRDIFDPVPAPSPGVRTVDEQEINDIVGLGDDRAWVINDQQIVSLALAGSTMTTLAKTAPQRSPHWRLGTGARVGDDVYVSCDGGQLIRNHMGSAAVERIPVSSQWYGSDTQMATLAGGDLMLFMRNMHVAVFSTKRRELTEIAITEGFDKSANIDPAFVRQDSYGNIWLGTRRSGLYKLNVSAHSVERMTFIDDVHIQALVEDQHRRLWITTLKDAICYEPSTGAVLLNSLVSSSRNNWNRQFFDLAICLAPDDDVLFGSSDGCVFLPASSGKYEVAKGQLRVSAIDIRNTDGDDLTINDDIEDGDSYTLAYDEKAVTFRFFYPNYNRSSALMYQVMLEGYDQTWRKPTYKSTAYFANLTPGRYTFRVRLISSPSQPPIDSCTLHITVKRPPWSSAAAWLFYLVCAGYLVYLLNSVYLKMRTNRLQLEQEKNEREREQRTNEMNMSFFANISHEFRNPITLIAGPLVSLRADDTLPRHVRQTLDVVCVSVNRMLRLIDQMLDFNQLETDALRLRVAEVDVAALLRRLEVVFAESAKIRRITLETDIATGDMRGFADTDKLEKIISNLFTNALKHTPDGGTITLTASLTAKGLTVALANSGSHISDDRLDDVFKRYYQLEGAQATHHYGWGTGIGLYYVKRLVGLHHGTISVRNLDDGVVFTFTIPTDRAAYTEAEKSASEQRVMQIQVNEKCDNDKCDNEKCDNEKCEEEKEEKGKEEKGNAGRRTRILIVDDDVDVAQYIRSLFTGEYDVENRYSAEAALEDLDQTRPDLIISDIIMGEMSGYDFCRRLKDDLMYSHIPVVLVTAKSNMDEQIEGLQLGAVAYVTKPFDPAYLRAIVGSQLAGVRSLRKRLGETVDTHGLTQSLSDQDRRFMDELYRLMEKRASELELNVATVCRDLLISQTKFTYKLRQLTGETPGSFFRKYKLNKAALMLKENKYPVSEIATLTGFSTAAHFSVAFKKQFGVTPSEYAAS